MNQTGYKGRIAIHEVIEIDSKVRKMISNQEEIDDIMKYLVEEQGEETLRDQALKLVKEGKTTVDEFNKFSILSQCYTCIFTNMDITTSFNSCFI